MKVVSIWCPPPHPTSPQKSSTRPLFKRAHILLSCLSFFSSSFLHPIPPTFISPNSSFRFVISKSRIRLLSRSLHISPITSPFPSFDAPHFVEMANLKLNWSLFLWGLVFVIVVQGFGFKSDKGDLLKTPPCVVMVISK